MFSNNGGLKDVWLAEVNVELRLLKDRLKSRWLEPQRSINRERETPIVAKNERGALSYVSVCVALCGLDHDFAF